MCGIVGYIGEREAQNILVAELKWLEYRGYDSAGIVTWNCVLCRYTGRFAEEA